MQAEQERTAGTLASAPVVRLEHSSSWRSIGFAEVWHHRELLYFFIWSQIRIRYKQTALGALWALLQPVLNMVLFTIFFGKLAKVPSDGLPYALFAYSALVPWTFFANALAQASNSLVGNASLITKVYFPRLILPGSSVLSGTLDWGLSFGLLLVMMAGYRHPTTWNVLWLPVYVLLALMVALGVSFWLSALNVQYRDVRFLVPFLVQVWMLATPIAYPSSLVPQAWRTIYGLNPMVGVVEGFRSSLLSNRMPDPSLTIASFIAASIILLSGALYFRRMEKTFADVI